jgi:hypothetical protein
MHFSTSDPSSNVQNLACFCQKSGALYLGEELVFGLKGLSHEIDFKYLDNNNIGLNKNLNWFLNFKNAPLMRMSSLPFPTRFR